VTFINHFFIKLSEGMVANMPIRHRGRNRTILLSSLIYPAGFMADAEHCFPFSEIPFDENAISRKDEIVCPLFQRKVPMWRSFMRKLCV
jgi:hypothetical protein